MSSQFYLRVRLWKDEREAVLCVIDCDKNKYIINNNNNKQ